MTVIIWLKHKGEIYIGADWRALSWHDIESDTENKFIKHGNTYIWTSWWVAEAWFLKKFLSINQDKLLETEDDCIHMYIEYKKFLVENKLMEIWDEPYIWYIVATPNWLFKVRPDWAVTPINKFCAMWSWQDFATWLYWAMEIKNAEAAIKFIIKEVAKVHVWVWWKIIVHKILSKKDIKKLKKATK